MPGSGPTDGGGAAGQRPGGGDPDEAGGSSGGPSAADELEALEEAVERLLEAYTGLRERVEQAEGAQRDLSRALAEAGPEELTPEEAEEKFRELVDENRRLREAVEEGRERAERIRSRLIMMEDEL